MINDIVHVRIINPISHLNQKNTAINHHIMAAKPLVISCIPSRNHRSKSLLSLSV